MQRGRGFVRAAFSFAKFAATGKVKLDSADKSDMVSFAKNAVSKELGENRAGPCGRLRTPRSRPLCGACGGDSRFAIYPLEQAPSAHLKQLVKKIGQEKAMEMLKGAPL